MKGGGGLIQTIVIIFTVGFISAVFVGQSFSENIKRQKIVLEETELFKVKNTFFLASKSLAETWRLSTIQSIFQAADASLDCGFDDKGKALRIGEGYWLRTPPESGGTSNSIPEFADPHLTIAPKEEKYNKAFPILCGPKRKDLNELLNRKMKEFTKEQEGFPSSFSFKSNDLDVFVRDSKSVLVARDDKTVSTTDYELEVSSGGCANSVSCSKAIKKDVSSIDTELARFVDLGREIVYEDGKITAGQGFITGSLLGYSLSFIRFLVEPETKVQYRNPFYAPAFRYQDVFSKEVFNRDPTIGRDDYLLHHQGILASIIRTERLLLRKSEINVNFNTLQLIAPCNSANRKCEKDVSILADGAGLVLHYDITIKIADKNQYYYHSEETNTFTKRPVELQIHAEDYLPALDCKETGIIEEIQKIRKELQRIFNWEPNKRQLMCFQGLLFSCGDPGIKNFPQQLIVQPGNNMPDGFWKCTPQGIVTP